MIFLLFSSCMVLSLLLLGLVICHFEISGIYLQPKLFLAKLQLLFFFVIFT